MYKNIIFFLVSLCLVKFGLSQNNTSNIIKNAVKDYDGNFYDAVIIGEQVWTKTNMRCTHYADGTEIPKAYTLKSGAYIVSREEAFYYVCPKKDTRYGLYYNHRAATRSNYSNSNPSGVQGICPNGWHIPSVGEWLQLFSYVGSIDEYTCFNNPLLISKALCSNDGWPEVEYTGKSSAKAMIGYMQRELNNLTGFSVLPAGEHTISHGYKASSSDIGDEALFWTSSAHKKYVSSDFYEEAYHISFSRDLPNPNFTIGDQWDGFRLSLYPTSRIFIDRGLSVRCIRDIDTISQKLIGLLKNEIEQYYQLFDKYPTLYQKYKVEYTIPHDTWGKHDLLQKMIDDISNKRVKLSSLYKSDSIVFVQYSDSLRKKVVAYNKLVNSYPNVYQDYQISYSMPEEFFGKSSSLHDTLVGMYQIIDIQHERLISLYKSDSIVFAHYSDTLQKNVNSFNQLVGLYPNVYHNFRVSYSLPQELFGKTSYINDTVVYMVSEIKLKQNLLVKQYAKDSLTYLSYNDTLKQALNNVNNELVRYPYNISHQIISDSLSIENFGDNSKLYKELSSKIESLPMRLQQMKSDIYEELKTSKPNQFVDIYYNQNIEKRHQADSIFIECRCKYNDLLQFNLDFIDGKIIDCDCRSKRFNEEGYLFKDKTEFDKYYNLQEVEFEQEITGRKQLKVDLQNFENELNSSKQVNLKKATLSEKPEVKAILDRIAYHQSHCYLEEAISILFKYNDGLSKEWEKNGRLFESQAEMYAAYISEDYAKVLKSKKKE